MDCMDIRRITKEMLLSVSEDYTPRRPTADHHGDEIERERETRCTRRRKRKRRRKLGDL